MSNAHEQTLQRKVERLVALEVLKKSGKSKWEAPMFIIPKSDKIVCFVTNFRKINVLLKHKPYPLPKMQDLL